MRLDDDTSGQMPSPLDNKERFQPKVLSRSRNFLGLRVSIIRARPNEAVGRNTDSPFVLRLFIPTNVGQSKERLTKANISWRAIHHINLLRGYSRTVGVTPSLQGSE